MRQELLGQHALPSFADIIGEDQLDVHELGRIIEFADDDDDGDMLTTTVSAGDIDTMSKFLGGLPLESVLYTSGGFRLTPPTGEDPRAKRGFKQLFRQYMDVLRADNESLQHKAAEFREAHNALVERFHSSMSVETLAKLLNMLADVQATVTCRQTAD